MTKIIYWDAVNSCQAERDMTPEEEAQRLLDEQEIAIQRSIDEASDVCSCQNSLINKYGWRAVRYITQEKLVDSGLLVSTNDTPACYLQICEWMQAVRDVDDSDTYTVQKTNLDNLDTWFPYISQAEYDTDVLNERGE